MSYDIDEDDQYQRPNAAQSVAGNSSVSNQQQQQNGASNTLTFYRGSKVVKNGRETSKVHRRNNSGVAKTGSGIIVGAENESDDNYSAMMNDENEEDEITKTSKRKRKKRGGKADAKENITQKDDDDFEQLLNVSEIKFRIVKVQQDLQQVGKELQFYEQFQRQTMHKFNKIQGHTPGTGNQAALSLLLQLSTDFIEEDQQQYDKLCYQLKTLLPKQIEILRQQLIIIKDERLVDIATQWNTMSSDVKKMLRKLQMLQHYLMTLEMKQQKMRSQILNRKEELTNQVEEGYNGMDNNTMGNQFSRNKQQQLTNGGSGSFNENDINLEDSMNNMMASSQQALAPSNNAAEEGQQQQLQLKLLRMGNDSNTKDDHQLRDMQANIRMQAEIMQRQDLLRDRKQRLTAINNMMSDLDVLCDDINVELRNQEETQINPLELEMDQVYTNTQAGTLELVDRLKKQRKSNIMLNYCFCGWLLFTLLLGMFVYTEIKERMERRRMG